MLRSIQILRAIAAWLVVGHHVVQLYLSLDAPGRVAGFFALYGDLGVDLFFVISGFVIYTSSTGNDITPGKFLSRRLVRVVPAYWFYTLIVAGILLVSPAAIPFTKLDWPLLAKSLVFVPAQNPSGVGPFPLLTVGWTLNFEMFFYCLFGISLFLPKKIALPGLVFGLWISHLVAHRSHGIIAFYSNPILYEFAIGIVAGVVFDKGWVQRLTHPLAAILIGCSIWLLTISRGNHDPVTAGLGFGVLVIVLLRYENWFAKLSPLSALGDWSYSTYLCHALILSAGLQIRARWDIPLYAIVPLMLMLIAATSKISYSLIEVKTKSWLIRAIRRHSAIGNRLYAMSEKSN